MPTASTTSASLIAIAPILRRQILRPNDADFGTRRNHRSGRERCSTLFAYDHSTVLLNQWISLLLLSRSERRRRTGSGSIASIRPVTFSRPSSSTRTRNRDTSSSVFGLIDTYTPRERRAARSSP